MQIAQANGILKAIVFQFKSSDGCAFNFMMASFDAFSFLILDTMENVIFAGGKMIGYEN